MFRMLKIKFNFRKAEFQHFVIRKLSFPNSMITQIQIEYSNISSSNFENTPRIDKFSFEVS